MCFDRELWRVIPIALIWFLLMQLITDFSVVKIELLYYIYRKNDVYCSLLYDIFLDSLPDFLDKLNHLTNKKVTGYIFMGGGKFYGKYLAVCRNRSNNIILKFKTNRVIIKINEKKFVIKDTLSSKEDLIAEISKAINENAS